MNTKGNQYIALTFDDGPNTTTEQILDVLEEHDAKATFFLLGVNINDKSVNAVIAPPTNS